MKGNGGRGKMKSDSRLKTALLYSPLLLCAGIMLPRLLSPHFGFFDDGVVLTAAQRVWTGQWHIFDDAYDGRLRPVYWLFYALVYRVFGQNPFWFFFCNLLLFLGITFCLIRLALTLGLNRKAAWATGFTFAVAGPVLENIYTISKPELLQGLLILLVLLTCSLYTRQIARLWKIALFLMSACLVFLACATKETAILLAPAALISLLVNWFWFRITKRPEHPSISRRLAFWWVALTGVLGYLIFHSLYLRGGLASSGYAAQFNFNLDWLIPKIRLWVDWLLRDYLYLVPIGVISLLVVLRKSNRDSLPLLVEGLAWFALWLGVYIPWAFTQEYYLFPLALGSAVLCGLFFSLTLELLQSTPLARFLAWAGLVLSVLLLLLTLPSQITNARLQLAIDRANADMLTYVVKHAHPGSTVWMNINPPNEYVSEFIIWVNQLEDRPDLKVDYFQSQSLAEAQAQGGEVWIVSPFMENQFYPSVRVGMSETLDQYLAGRGETLDEIRQSFPSSNFDPLRSFCPLARSIAYCKVPNAPLDRRVFAYGWRVIRIP
jgi:hypothetical protein